MSLLFVSFFKNYLIVYILRFIPKAKPVPELKVKGSKSHEAQSKGATKAKPKDLPTVKWTLVPIHLTQVEAEDRIFIREFILRFGDLLDPVIAKTNIEELELIGGRPGKSDDDSGVTGWVSDACIKALAAGLLGLLAKDHESRIAKVCPSRFLVISSILIF